MNGSSEEEEFTLSKGSGGSSVSAVLKETETTISVNWSGGGQIKPEAEEWTLESLMRAAAGFPTKVAACPQRTYAILTKYNSNLSFVAYARKNKIRLRDYSVAARYAGDLLDMYMEYKSNLARLQDVLSNPNAYKLAPVSDPIDIKVNGLVEERKNMKKAMKRIVHEIDIL
jgi:hypothetical protein